MIQAIILNDSVDRFDFLVTCLESHPEVRCLGEILAGSRLFHVPEFLFRLSDRHQGLRYLRSGAWFPTRVMRRYLDEGGLADASSGLRPVMAFKVMYNQIQPAMDPRKFLVERKDLRIFHLRRKTC